MTLPKVLYVYNCQWNGKFGKYDYIKKTYMKVLLTNVSEYKCFQ